MITNNIIDTTNYQSLFQTDEYNVDTNIITSHLNILCQLLHLNILKLMPILNMQQLLPPVKYSTSESHSDYATETQ